ncbi:MAG: pinensin family lanthipeptide [Longimicrobiaceae bacterium]
MKKLRLDLDSLKVDSFAAEADSGKSGTVHGHTAADTNCQDTCGALGDTCAVEGCSQDFCTGYCTGIGAGCYTNDPIYYACTGQDPCTGAQGCTRTTCTGYC